MWIHYNEINYVESTGQEWIYAYKCKDLRIEMSPNTYLTAQTHLWINFGDGTTEDIVASNYIEENDGTSTIFNIKHNWSLPDNALEEREYAYAFYYQNVPELHRKPLVDITGSGSGWIMKWYTGVWVSGIIETQIRVKRHAVVGCPFLYTYDGKWHAENNVLVWAENATRPYLKTMDSYLFTGKEIDGNITVGIGEPGDDVDYINAVKLYKVDTVPDGYKVAESYNGKVYEIEITDLSRDGDGIGRYGEYTIYVPGARKGEKVKVKILKVKKNVAFGRKVN